MAALLAYISSTILNPQYEKPAFNTMFFIPRGLRASL